VIRGYKTELDLNNVQRTACLKHAGCARFVYNWGLARSQEVYRKLKLKAQGQLRGKLGFPKFKNSETTLVEAGTKGDVWAMSQMSIF